MAHHSRRKCANCEKLKTEDTKISGSPVTLERKRHRKIILMMNVMRSLEQPQIGQKSWGARFLSGKIYCLLAWDENSQKSFQASTFQRAKQGHLRESKKGA